MTWATKTHDFSAGTTAKSQEVDDNFDDMVDQLNTAMPSGGIIMWSGSIVSIPSGWYLCNGSNSTPDLRDRFVIGAGSTYAVDATGGTSTINLQHSHTVNSHTHGISHDHTYSGSTAMIYTTQYFTPGGGDRLITGSHSHTYSGTTGGSSNASSGAASDSGMNNQLSTTQSILNPYYALAFIMKS